MLADLILFHAGRVRCRPSLARVVPSCRAAPATLREPVTAHLLSMAVDQSTYILGGVQLVCQEAYIKQLCMMMMMMILFLGVCTVLM